MREIIFRGKRKDNGEWVYGSYHCCVGDAKIRSMHREDKLVSLNRHWILSYNLPDTSAWDITDTYSKYEVIPETVGQYVGKTDKNSSKIFDGDILGQDCNMVDDYSGKSSVEVQKLIVRWSEEKLLWTVYCPDSVYKSDWGHIPNKAYVIGNIHDKEELLQSL